MKKRHKQAGVLSKMPVSFVVLTAVVWLACGVVAGALMTAHFHTDKPAFASGQQMESARKAVIDAYFTKSTTCSQDTRTASDRVATFYKYLRINRYADRAVIRGCYDGDSLLARVADGSWQRTFVNVSLDLRANPVWQKACKIDDITVADTVVRPENRSIDDYNLRDCKYLADHDQVRPWGP